MPVESDADRLAILEDWDIATISATPIKGVFDNAYTAVDTGDSDVTGTEPRFFCRTIDLPAITLGTTTATINAVVYVIVDTQADGQGMTLLILRK